MEKNKTQKVYKIIMLVILTAFVTFIVTSLSMYTYFKNNTGYGLINTTSNTSTNTQDIPSYLKQIRSAINKYYLWKDKISEEDLENGAIEGYVKGLGDEYTEYVPSSEMKEYTENINGSFVGIGVYMVKDEKAGRVLIYYPIPESPAEKAGIKAGDLIISVDGKEYTADDFEEISKYIKGEEGTTVNIVIERDGERKSFDVVRKKINTNPISKNVYNKNVGYIKIPSFDEGTAEAFKTKLQDLVNNEGVKSVVIDLRNNGGGLVDQATKIADYFLEKKETILITKDNEGNKQITYSEMDPIFNMPIVILVNKNTASASEILTAALKENGKAKVVGETTYGKGVIQTLFTLSDGSGLKITTAEYYSPKENTIHKVGITPDSEVKLPDSVKSMYVLTEDQDTQLKAAIELLK